MLLQMRLENTLPAPNQDTADDYFTEVLTFAAMFGHEISFYHRGMLLADGAVVA